MTDIANTTPSLIVRFLIATLILFVIWLLLVGKWDWAENSVGLAVAMITALISLKNFELLDGIKFTAMTPFYMVHYLVIFIIALIRSNVDVALRVLSPQLPINPAIVTVKTQLQSPLGKLILANSITLTPGTLTVDIIDDNLQIHWIDSTPGTDLAHATQAISDQFERDLRRIFI